MFSNKFLRDTPKKDMGDLTVSTVAEYPIELIIAAIKRLAAEKEYKGKDFTLCLHAIQFRKETRQLEIYSQPKQELKYHLRDGLFAEVLKIPFQNISGRYYFLVNIRDLLKNEEIIKKIEEIKLEKSVKAKQFSFLTSGTLFERLRLVVDNTTLGQVTINNPEAGDLSLARLDVLREHQRKGYGSTLMDRVMDICLERCADIQIDVDPPVSAEDDPLEFYKKYFISRGIFFNVGSSPAAVFFKCQATVFVKAIDILVAKYPNLYLDPSLNLPQLLAQLFFGLSTEQVKGTWFKREHYLALKRGVSYQELRNATQLHVETLVYCNIPSFALIKDMNGYQLHLLKSLQPEKLANASIYEVIKKMYLFNLSNDAMRILQEILKESSIPVLLSQQIPLITEQLGKLNYLHLSILSELKLEARMNLQTYEILLKMDQEVLKEWFYLHKKKEPCHVIWKLDAQLSLEAFKKEVEQMRLSMVSLEQACGYKEEIKRIIALNTNSKDPKYLALLQDYCKKIFRVLEFSQEERKSLQGYYTKFLEFEPKAADTLHPNVDEKDPTPTYSPGFK